MENTEDIVSRPVDKKEWVAPELQKIDIAELTAHFLLGHANDDNSTS
jgi:hypothetical protein